MTILTAVADRTDLGNAWPITGNDFAQHANAPVWNVGDAPEKSSERNPEALKERHLRTILNGGWSRA